MRMQKVGGTSVCGTVYTDSRPWLIWVMDDVTYDDTPRRITLAACLNHCMAYLQTHRIKACHVHCALHESIIDGGSSHSQMNLFICCLVPARRGLHPFMTLIQRRHVLSYGSQALKTGTGECQCLVSARLRSKRTLKCWPRHLPAWVFGCSYGLHQQVRPPHISSSHVKYQVSGLKRLDGGSRPSAGQIVCARSS